MRLFIVGSCVSRDALSFAGDPADIAIAGYHARTSLATLSSGPVPLPPRIDEMNSNWRRRMVEADHRKVLIRSIAAATFDVLLLDLIDERFHLLETTGQRVITHSADYASIAPSPLTGRRIPSGSDRHVALWRAGFHQVVAALKQKNRVDLLRVNRVFWASEMDDGRPIEGFDARRIAQANTFLRDRYADIESELGAGVFIDYPAECLRADPAHRWGLSPFHYVQAFYRHQLDQLRKHTFAGSSKATTVAPDTVAQNTWRVRLDFSAKAWTACIEPDYVIPAAQAAFYLMREGKRVAMQWYSDARIARFEPQSPGTYHVVGFLRENRSQPVVCRSESVTWGTPPLYDIDRWNSIVVRHADEKEWAHDLRDAIHQVNCGEGGAVDIRIQGVEQIRPGGALLVGFSGAVTDRGEKSAPFFHGAGVAAQLRLPIASVADPTIGRSADLNLAWYAGHTGRTDLLQRIAALLDRLSEATGTRLVLFGGSGGGFATLAVLGHLRSPACGLVWNPQTRIAHYHRPAVRRYLQIALGGDLPSGANAAVCERALEACGVQHDLTRSAPAHRHPVLYLQNRTDKLHVHDHAEPFITAIGATRETDRIFSTPNGEVFWFGNWGTDHVAPPQPLLLRLLERLSSDADTLALAVELDQGAHDDLLPSTPN
jgi:hypothetical protein